MFTILAESPQIPISLFKPSSVFVIDMFVLVLNVKKYESFGLLLTVQLLQFQTILFSFCKVISLLLSRLAF